MNSTTPAAEAIPQLIQNRKFNSRNKLYILLIVAVWLALYVPGMFTPPLLDDADSVHAEAAREMVERGDWTTLYINGLRYLEKAPLMYWGMCASFTAFGVTEWTARLPLALGMLGALLALYAFGRRFFGESAGLYAALAMALSFGPYIFTRILIPDVISGLWLTLGFYFFLNSLEEERPSRLSCWGLAVTAALGVLTKGLIGVVFPFGIIFLYLLLTRNLRHFLRMRMVSSFLIFLAVAAPWHIAAGLANPAQGESKGFFWFYFVNEHFLRYLNKRFPKDYDTVPFSVFWGMLLVWLGPWTAFHFKAIGRVPHRWRELTSLDRRGRALLLCAIWALVIYGFFSFSSRQEYYIVPALPAVALLIGAWMGREQESPAGSAERRAGRRASWVLAAIAVPAAIVAAALLWTAQAPGAGTELADALKKNPEQYALSFGHFFDLTGPAMGFFRVPLAMTAVALFLGTVLNVFFRRRGEVSKGNIALALMMLVFLHAAHMGLVIFSPVLSSKELSRVVEQQHRPGDIVVINGAYEEGSTLNFYGHFRLHVVNSRTNGNMYYGSLFPDSPKIFETDESLAKLWAGPQRVFLWTEDDAIPPYIQQAGYKIIAHSGGKYILSNRDNQQ